MDSERDEVGRLIDRLLESLVLDAGREDRLQRVRGDDAERDCRAEPEEASRRRVVACTCRSRELAADI